MGCEGYKNSFVLRGMTLTYCLISPGIFFCCSITYGQNIWGIRLNQNTDIFKITYQGDTRDIEERQFRFGRISMALTYSTGKSMHALELFVPEVNSETTRARFPWPQKLHRNEFFDNKMSSYALRYGLTRNILSIGKHFSLTGGAALNPYYQKAEGIPRTVYAYYNSRTVIGVSFNFIGGISYKAFKRLTFTLDCPFKLIDFYRQSYEVKNPAIPVNMQKMHSTEFDLLLNVYTIRAGVSYSFNGKER